jgi:hypothetical protein
MYVPPTLTPPKLSILSTPCIYVFNMINSDISLNRISQISHLVFLTEILSVYCKVGTWVLCIILTNFRICECSKWNIVTTWSAAGRASPLPLLLPANSATFNVSSYVLYSAFGKSLCTYKRCSSIERTVVSKSWIKQSHTLPVFHFNHCLTTE